MMTKLHLGCGNRKIYGFINVDIRNDVNPDLCADITQMSSFYKKDAIDVIYACHVLEHFPLKPFKMSQKTYKDVLKDWYHVLKPGGILRLSIPNLKAVFDYYNKTQDLKPLMSFIYGGEKHDFDFHYHGWDFESLTKDLEEIGFKEVKLYDWRKTEHFYVDDYSQSYLPHMDKINGTLLSLNVEATK